MKTITRTVYEYQELTPEAQQWAQQWALAPSSGD